MVGERLEESTLARARRRVRLMWVGTAVVCFAALATFVEAQLCSGQEVIVVGGGNSAGQAAVFLAQSTKHVYMLVRGPGLTDTMSKYLIRRIEQTPNISLLTETEVVSLKGVDHLEGGHVAE